MDDGADGVDLDILRQMGYNSLGNIFLVLVVCFCYAKRSSMRVGLVNIPLRWGRLNQNYRCRIFPGLFFGIIAAACCAGAAGAVYSHIRAEKFLHWLIRDSSSYELTITVNYVGGASGISMPLFPGDIEFRFCLFLSCVLCDHVAHFAALDVLNSLVWPLTRYVMMKTTSYGHPNAGL